ncbi:TIGR03885 family FMN-dependent LLM class oxidoreductase [Salinarimonas soli]|uniref:TIGR03885 family FMN-dependent LLM class oxidoreductase n=1 Tax=Salinarimonas soli TaxID=1638099 RepID=A0A5B2VG05_9HYPH|nr:TIGR03885 family FMN-dependent LLM class oxidoreductase [Salinarimonas soli]KAA2237805.1 TIGR03885 family FMN-dependent LLM class oxidoreductase [Salinarimonas soli]
MTAFGFHASHEQFDPRELLACVQLAESAGFERVTASDHFFPWSEEQGQSGFVWSWLGAAMQSTGLRYRTVSAPGWRYHPAILAQAGATLGVMFPERLWMCLGSGQALNEGITGLNWVHKPERKARLEECAAVMRALWAGETVSHHGRIVVEDAKLYTRPERPLLLVGAAVSVDTARWVGGWADGLITVAGGPVESLRRVVDAFREGGGEGKPVLAQLKLAWGPDEAAIREDAFRQWRTNLFEGDVLWEIRTPKQFEQAAAFVRPEDLDRSVRVSSDLGRHAAWIGEYLAVGIDELSLHNVATNQRAFIEAFGERVLPQVRGG